MIREKKTPIHKPFPKLVSIQNSVLFPSNDMLNNGRHFMSVNVLIATVDIFVKPNLH